MDIKILKMDEISELGAHELIHTRPSIVLRLGAACESCFIEINPGLTGYYYQRTKQWFCVSCIHYHHERMLMNCSVCQPNLALEV